MQSDNLKYHFAKIILEHPTCAIEYCIEKEKALLYDSEKKIFGWVSLSSIIKWFRFEKETNTLSAEAEEATLEEVCAYHIFYEKEFDIVEYLIEKERGNNI